MRNDIETYERWDGKWANRFQGKYDTQEEAERAAHELARRMRVESFVRGLTGRLLRRNSYGHDPKRTRN